MDMIPTLPNRFIHSEKLDRENPFFPKGATIDLDNVIDEIEIKDYNTNMLRLTLVKALEGGHFKGGNKKDPFCQEAEQKWAELADELDRIFPKGIYEISPAMGVSICFPIAKPGMFGDETQSQLKRLTIAENAHMLTKEKKVATGIVRFGDNYYLTSGVFEEKGCKYCYIARKLDLTDETRKKIGAKLTPTN